MKLIKSILFGTTAVLAGVAAFGSQSDAAEIEHTVTSSDTLWGLSMKYYGSDDYIDTIAKDNKIADTDMIYDGEVLTINTDSSATKASTENAETTSKTEAATATAETTETTTDSANYSGTTMYMESTAYSSDPADTLGGGTITATGQNLLENPMAVAVDPSVIPLGTHLYVEGYGEAYAVDTGSAIQGNIIDVHFSTYEQCVAWGRRQVKVTIID
ncbi:3D domain-containing protein [Enterococcus asini]|uniref:3D domain-containing protein n=1 Tax=Enterococcus asini TaxID=57732 RepID=UPI00288DA554|nr:3D domain-containing protein [Enterococcus asini]MDT2757043.1 3D domain-containing protein [Enterococcus asini]